MEKRFKVLEIHICPVYHKGTNFKPDLNYPTRYCVIDEEKGIAIDIKTKLKYDYVETMSNLYFMSQSHKKIKGDNRVAIFPYASISIDSYNLKEAEDIITQLKNNREFTDGNDVYNNKQYLEYLKQESLEEQNNIKNKKVKKLGKKRK